MVSYITQPPAISWVLGFRKHSVLGITWKGVYALGKYYTIRGEMIIVIPV